MRGRVGHLKIINAKYVKQYFLKMKKKTNKIGYQTKTDLNLHYDVGLVY